MGLLNNAPVWHWKNMQSSFSFALSLHFGKFFLIVLPTNFFKCSSLCAVGTKIWPQVVTFLVFFNRQYTEISQLDGTDGNRLEDNLESSEQRLFWHEDSKPGTLVWTAVGPLDQALRSHTSVPCKSYSSSERMFVLET